MTYEALRRENMRLTETLEETRGKLAVLQALNKMPPSVRDTNEECMRLRKELARLRAALEECLGNEGTSATGLFELGLNSASLMGPNRYVAEADAIVHRAIEALSDQKA
jgi:hypothetical protein